MCGIAGYYNPKIIYSDSPKYNFELLNRMIKTIKHRGPDAEGTLIIDNCCLAHTRLSIIDLEAGQQPMTIRYQESKYHVIYNGEIYNHREIKKELIRQGFAFNTQSDTEIIGKAFIYWGTDFVNQLNGIFAIAIYDESNHTLFLFRDRFGIKPLYYTMSSTTLIFSSRIDTLFEYPNVKPKLDNSSFNEIFTIGPAKTYGKGVFANIDEVLPGEYIVYSRDYIVHKQYYQITSRPHKDSYADTIEKTTYLLEESIKMQMISDVPICTFLSGGIDSSIVTSVCSKNMNESLDTYSFDFTNNNEHFKANSFQISEDRPYVDIMVNYLHTNHTYLYCDNLELADLLYESVDSRCLPTMADIDASLLFFCRKVANNHKVALTGECADEIFGGYPWFHRQELLLSNSFPWMTDIRFRKSILNPEFAASLHMQQYINDAYNKSVSEINLLPYESPLETKRRIVSYLNIRWFMQTLLDRMDRTSMHHGLEARVPFADHRLIDYVFNVPWKMKSKNGIPKELLRICSERFLPAEILNRPKNPYPKTYNPTYEQILCKRLREVLSDKAAPIRSYLDMKNVMKFINEPKQYGEPWYGQLMAGPQMAAYLLQINYWLEKYIKK